MTEEHALPCLDQSSAFGVYIYIYYIKGCPVRILHYYMVMDGIGFIPPFACVWSGPMRRAFSWRHRERERELGRRRMVVAAQNAGVRHQCKEGQDAKP